MVIGQVGFSFFYYLDSWLSGLKRHPAKVLDLRGSVGSNPTLSAISSISIMVIMPAFQAGDVSSILICCSTRRGGRVV